MNSILISGGTGSLGHALVSHFLTTDIQRIAVLSRDELKQSVMAERFPDPRMRFFLGDVRDPDRLEQAFQGIDAVVNAAALKRVDRVAYDPSEVLKTNVIGTENVIQAAVRAGVRKVLLISSDKAVEPQNIYGATKMCAEWLTVTANSYSYPQGTRCSAVRYGNVVGSRGSVVELWRNAKARGEPIQLTDDRCTRFWITLPQAVELVMSALNLMDGGEIFVPILPSMRITDLADAIVGPDWPRIVKGLRPGGEKLHEKLLNADEVTRTVRAPGYYVVNPALRFWGGVPWIGDAVPQDFVYESNVNNWWLTVDEMQEMVG